MAVIANRTRTADTKARDQDSHEGLRHWPLGRRAWAFVGPVYIGLVLALVALGLLIVHVLQDTAFGRADVRVSRWFADRREATLNDVAHTVSFVSDSVIVIPLCAVLLVACAIAFRRWHEIVMVIGALLLEKAMFLPTTFIVDRDRPPVGQLAGDPPSSSFFSGHVAAAVAFYFGLYIVVRWHTESRAARRIAALIASMAVIVVALSRLVEGMHYLSDVAVGATVGAISLAVVRKALSYDHDTHHDAPQGLNAIPTASNVP